MSNLSRFLVLEPRYLKPSLFRTSLVSSLRLGPKHLRQRNTRVSMSLIVTRQTA